MSRTEGVTLPRLPTSHVRVTSPGAIQPHSAWPKGDRHRRTLSEPHYSAYVGTPRQDVPHNIYHDPAMFDDVFDKEGKLLLGRNTPKFTSPLHTLGYNSLHDPHCKKLFLNNRKIRSHLMNLGLITDDLRVVASTREQRQKIRAHELLERKEQLIQRLEERETQRLEKLQRQLRLPKTYQESLVRQAERREKEESVRKMKLEKIVRAEQEQQAQAQRQREERRRKLQKAQEEAELLEQARRNAARAQQELTEMAAYERQYGKYGYQVAQWHRDADRIHNRMIIMEHKHWSKMRKKKWLSESYPPQHSPQATPPRHSPQPTPPSGTADGEGLLEHPAVVLRTEKAKGKMPAEVSAVREPDKDGPKKLPEEDVRHDGRDIVSPSESETIAEPPDVKESSREMEAEVKVRGKVEAITEDKAEANQLKKKVEAALAEPPASEAKEGAPPRQEAFIVLTPEQGAQELAGILVEFLASVDSTQSGFISTDDFAQVLNSRDLGLQLDENELLHIAGQADVYGNGWVPYSHVAPQLPDLLLSIYSERAQQATLYGAYTEEQWCQICLPEGAMCYFNKFTGVMQFSRPEDFRPALKDDVFEDSIVDFFETADVDRDGILEYTDFYSLLVSPMVSTRIYSNQMEELLELFQSNSADGRMELTEFAPIARVLLLMVYQNAYPNIEEWIELESRKCGPFWFNKLTGETFVPQSEPTGPQLSPTGGEDAGSHGGQTTEETERKSRSKSRKKKKRSKKKTPEEEEEVLWHQPSQGPPPLRKRSSHSREGSRSQEEKEAAPHLLSPSLKPERIGEEVEGLLNTKTEEVVQLPEYADKGEEKPIRTIAKFETIPEEDEEEDSTNGAKSADIFEADDHSNAAAGEAESQMINTVLSQRDESFSDERQLEASRNETLPDTENACDLDNRNVASHQVTVAAEVHPTEQTTEEAPVEQESHNGIEPQVTEEK